MPKNDPRRGGDKDCFSAWGALIYSEKSFLPKAKPSKIKTLDSRLRGNDNFFSVSLVAHGACRPMILPPWSLVYQHMQRWLAAGCFLEKSRLARTQARGQILKIHLRARFQRGKLGQQSLFIGFADQASALETVRAGQQ